MIKQVFVLFAITLAIHADSTKIQNVNSKETNISPYSLLDEAQAELEELTETVQSKIEEAFNRLDDLVDEARSFHSNIMASGEILITNAYQDIDSKLTTLKNLAFAADKDISSCLNNREDLLNSLPDQYLKYLAECTSITSGYINNLFDSSRYLVDTIINEVHNLEFQLGRCEADSIICISPIVTQIELQMVDLPQKIQTQINEASSQFEYLKQRIFDCRNPIIAEASSEGNTILDQIADCVNQIL